MVKTRLSGLIGVLDWRDLEFVEPIPSGWTCKLCGVVASHVSLLPCSHEFCEVCSDQITARDQRCPLDGCKYLDGEVRQLVVNPSQLGERVACCVNVRHGCNFRGPVRKVKQHFQDGCSFNTVNCFKCGNEVLQKEYLDHFLSSCSELTAPVVVPTLSRQETCEDAKSSAEELNFTTLKICDGNMVTQDNVNSLLERLAAFAERVNVLEDALSRQICENLPTRPRRNSSHVMVPGRSLLTASNSASCCIGNFYTRKDKVSTSNTTHCYGQSLMVAGYTLKVGSEFRHRHDSTWLSLSLVVCEGAFDGFVSWPFRRRCTLVLVHPLDSRKNIRRPVNTELVDNRCYLWFRKPIPGHDNEEFGHQLFDSKYVECTGFVVNDSICVSVELE
ncbi:unnamed protein product [Ixodes hexagonus]